MLTYPDFNRNNRLLLDANEFDQNVAIHGQKNTKNGAPCDHYDDFVAVKSMFFVTFMVIKGQSGVPVEICIYYHVTAVLLQLVSLQTINPTTRSARNVRFCERANACDLVTGRTVCTINKCTRTALKF